MLSRLLSKVQQLKGRSPQELYARASQRAYALRERAALAFGTASVSRPGVNAQTFAQPFFAGLSDRASTLDVLRRIAPQDEARVLQRARAIEVGDIPLLGYGLVHVGPSPEWQRDPFANLSAPLRHWSTIPYLDTAVVGDHKVVWEISRHQYFVTLGQAWLYSRDERWPRAFARYLQSWLEHNPATVGMNWASSLEVSYRAISWIWAMQLMRDAPVIDATVKADTLRSLQSHGQHLERYLSTYFSPNTHLTGEALGLFYIGTQCPELPQAKRWRDLGASVLQASVDKQVLPDGVYFEQATQYHRYTIDIYLHYLLLSRAAGRRVSPNVEVALHRLFDVLLHLSRADGTIPLIGDDDGGRLMQLDDRLPNDVRSLLAMGAVVLDRHDLAWTGRGDDAAMCWTLGATAIETRDSLIDEPPAETARAFASGGLYVMRDGWSDTDGHMVVDAGPHGALSYGHSHADALSIELAIGGRPLFVDPGTFTYTGAERDAFRTTAAHNTVEIDATSTSRPGRQFRWESVAHATALSWTKEAEFTYFTGQHSAYESLASGLIHTRGALHAAPGLWIIRDELTATGRHDAVLRWHCAPGIRATTEATTQAGMTALRLSDGAADRAALVIFGGTDGALCIENGWVSEQYGHKSAASVCAWRETTHGNATLASIVIDLTRYDVLRDATADFRKQVKGASSVLAIRDRNSRAQEYTLVVVGDGVNEVRFQKLDMIADISSLRVDAVTGELTGILAVGVMAAIRRGVVLALAGRSRHKQWVSASSAGQSRSGFMTPVRSSVAGAVERPVSVPSTV